MSRYRRPSLGSHFGYTPGEQPRGAEGWTKLNTNESPFPPSPRVAKAVAAVAPELRRYPDPFAEPLRSALAAHHLVEPHQVMVGNGADDVLECCFRAFIEPGDSVAYPIPTYSLVPVLTSLHNGVSIEMPVKADGNHPAELRDIAASLIVLVNPNAPTGVWIEPRVLERHFASKECVIVIDEAYCDFAPASCVPLLSDHDNWLVVRTFSKSHALAGLRVGYAVGSRELIADLYAVKDSYPVDRCAIAGALAALEDREHHEKLVAEVRAQRQELTYALEKMGWKVLPSQANFVFAKPPTPATEVVNKLRGQHVLVRHFAEGQWDEWIRVTIGTEHDNRRLIEALVN